MNTAEPHLISSSFQCECTVPWEKFDTCSDAKIAEELEGNGSFNEHDLILLPCNPGRSHHWFLIAVLPKLNLVVALDSAASSHVKPSVNIAMDKCMRVLSLLPNPGKEWMYYCNTAEDVLQQGNAFDCGVFLCIYARALSLGDPLIVPDSLPDARLIMIAELHQHQLGGIPPQELQPESYYAVDYINKLYIGRLLAIRDGVLHFKFLHSNQCIGSMAEAG